MDHEHYIDEALLLAARGRGWVSPNPVVGALVVRDGKIVGRGWHKKFGGPHAEVFALQEAGEAARGATLYCTLEPCNHTGKTPPCSQAVIAAGIKCVVLGASDSNPAADGGIEAMRAAGIEVIDGIRGDACRRINAPFFKYLATGLPLVNLKWAMTLDGKIASASGDSKWITSDAAREEAQLLRAAHDAVLVGIGTMLADQPRLNCRVTKDGAEVHQPRRIILDNQARTPLDGPFWSAEPAGAVTVVCKANAPLARVGALQNRGAHVLRIADAFDDVDEGEKEPELQGVLRGLGDMGIRSILVEGGSRVLGSFVDEHFCDGAFAFIAPRILGGAASLAAVGGGGESTMAETLNLRRAAMRQVGPDYLLSGVLSEWDWLLQQL